MTSMKAYMQSVSENINWETLDPNTPDEDIETMLQEETGNIDLPMGEGLFSTVSYTVGDVIAEFRGDYNNTSEYEERRKAGTTCYVVYLRRNLYLDCMQL